MITINEAQIKELEALINPIPTAYGLPLFQFFGKLAQEQNVKQEQNPPTEVKED